jgi:hypothetical protein
MQRQLCCAAAGLVCFAAWPPIRGVGVLQVGFKQQYVDKLQLLHSLATCVTCNFLRSCHWLPVGLAVLSNAD